jgi:hypothetical protein
VRELFLRANGSSTDGFDGANSLRGLRPTHSSSVFAHTTSRHLQGAVVDSYPRGCVLLVLYSKIPSPVIDIDGCYLVGCERNVLVPANVYDAAFTGHNLVEAFAVLEGDRHNLIARTGFAVASQAIGVFARNWNQTLHCITSGMGFGGVAILVDRVSDVQSEVTFSTGLPVVERKLGLVEPAYV